MAKSISLLFLLVCLGGDQDKIAVSQKGLVTTPGKTTTIEFETKTHKKFSSNRTETFCLIDPELNLKLDTGGLTIFWRDFIHAVETKDKALLRRSLSLDSFLAQVIAYPQFMKECDTLRFSQQIELYGLLKLSPDNFEQYFDSIFTSNFSSLISTIKIEDIMNNGLNTGYSYLYTYSPNQNDFPCAHEKVIVLNVFYDPIYNVSISFCC
jgi:hypothetical protein